MLRDLNELITFERIASLGSLTAAANDLGLSLAVVSRRLATLEDKVGLRLVNRTTRSLSITEEGRSLLSDIREALSSINACEQKILKGKELPFGLLRISSPVALGNRVILPLAGRLIEQYPDLRIEVNLSDEISDVVGGNIDVAIRIGNGVNNEGAIIKKLVNNRRILTAAPDYIEKYGIPLSPENLEDHILLRYASENTPWKLINKSGDKVTFTFSCRLRASNGEAVHILGKLGYGIMFRSIIDVKDEIAAGGLVNLLPEWSSEDLPVVALIPAPSKVLPMKTKIFLDALQSVLNEG